MSESRKGIKRALLSVYDKTGLVELATALHEAGVEIVSTGSTAAHVAEAGVPVTRVEDLTGFPECLEGRVKTLHPRVHAGILADTRKPEHLAQLDELGVAPFQLVVVNLYPFSQTVASGADFDACVEQIDIGGPSMVRAAAKNHPSVAVVVNPDSYGEVARAAAEGGFTLEERRALAAEAFRHTAEYDIAVATWISEGQWVGGSYRLAHELRYGENPHQQAALYTSGGGLAGATQHHGKEMSYNNYQDADAAWRAAWDHEDPCVAIIKHANPCGIAVAKDIAAAHAGAHACDPLSAYGGVIAANREVTLAMAEQIKPIFTEVVIAPSYEDAALELLKSKKNLRILEAAAPEAGKEIKQISGGLLVQSRDALDAPGDDPAAWTLVAGEGSEELLRELRFAWRTVRAVKSNAILIAKDGATVGVGMGQVNRVDSAKLAVERANTLGEGNRTEGAVAASDAFFPFADGFEVLAQAGVKAVVQPGGSIRDEEVIEAAKKAGVTMYLTGARHFAH
ncbi:bifunctional phosphoribosylaminoimidazolecarboxamide formyltransferase/IMP cyclohydrolase [Corynebacterium mastitidis]|uniref:Bifunctional purine biosynthesis protein PurH n=1 Tax=Corynebacterium mastitidis TaxID=161890 RepID=A0A2N0X9W5_9CORY|nr:bifunctional phosphoribosylaminoimidazolecarboxamide formyltransferase/IMP cyclohydrolase [Corynebacterium mastitidis]MCH6197741.1 bifunctional phosphoribosylaminoimidazolecarboxamide formyltransferase/IMP cyclohydrolase [Corynebacterium mastitidis]PKF69502.1 bifunctional phosphoribosylaminoimidazolecarboxamide formyltransferase/inosine monophosphate cyclohydrolase [Corynebacterium mastitidis]